MDPVATVAGVAANVLKGVVSGGEAAAAPPVEGGNGLTEEDEKFLDLVALVVSASPLPAARVFGLLKSNRKMIRTPENIALLREWGVI